MSFNWPLASTTWGQEEVSAGISILESGNTTMGKDVKYFETEFADYFGSKFAIMTNSGSSANLLILAALMIKFKNQIVKLIELMFIHWDKRQCSVFEINIINILLFPRKYYA